VQRLHSWRPGPCFAPWESLGAMMGGMALVGREEQCNGCTFGCRGWVPRPLVIKAGTVPTGNQGGQGAQWQPKRALCPLAAGGGKWHDAILCGWNE